jgi:hypothetical protein
LFKFTGKQFVNYQYNDRVLDTATADAEGQAVRVAKNSNGVGQRWRVVYLDKGPKTETKGLNEEFGFHINRPFYLVS